MDAPSPALRTLARRLIAEETARPKSAGARSNAAVQVCEKLRTELTRFAGAEGFSALMRRALVLARADVPALSGVTVTPDGVVDGLEALVTEEADAGIAAATALTTQLLGLLVTFIGEPLTQRLVSEAWPDLRG
ncbi:MAG TPA: hypothetical protein VM165_22450 [Planctomycetaceae bacterium]|nr:hypothetical protein [Planctomycetaceae bacterium]